MKNVEKNLYGKSRPRDGLGWFLLNVSDQMDQI